MSRTGKELFDDAKNIAGRGSTRLAVVGAALLLIWSITFETGGDFIDANAHGLQLAFVRSDKLSGSLTRLTFDKKSVSQKIALLMTDQQAACADKSDQARCDNLGEAIASAERRKAELDTKIEEYRTALKKKTDYIAAIQTKLAERVSFDLGQGVKLPFSLLIAPLVWLSLLAALLSWIASQQKLFWGLVGQAVAQSGWNGWSLGLRPTARLRRNRRMHRFGAKRSPPCTIKTNLGRRLSRRKAAIVLAVFQTPDTSPIKTIN